MYFCTVINIAKSGYLVRLFVSFAIWVKRLTILWDLQYYSQKRGGEMFKRVLCLLLFIMIIATGCGRKKDEPKDLLDTIKARGKVIVGVKNDTKPFGFLDKDGNLIGYDIDIAKKIAYLIFGDENQIEFVPVTPSNRIMKLNSGQVDMLVATMSVTSQRLQLFDFSTTYHIAGQAIMVRKGSTISSLKELNKKKAIIVYGSTSEKNLRLAVPDAIIIGYKTYPEAYRALKAGKAEAIVADDTILLRFAIDDPSVVLLSKRYSMEHYAVAFRKGKKSERLLDKVNFMIESMVRSGEISRMQEEWGIK